MPVIPHLSSARVTTLATLSLCLALSACGGGGDADAGEQDLAGFTAAWMSYQMLASVNMLQMAAGGTGSCGLGGTVAYDAVAGTSTLDQCHTRAFPYQVYSGRNSISQLVSNADRSQVSAAIRSRLGKGVSRSAMITDWSPGRVVASRKPPTFRLRTGRTFLDLEPAQP